MNPVQRVWGRIQEFFTATSTNLYARVQHVTRRWRSTFRQPVNNWGRADYAYFLNLYYARIAGLELSGLFVRPIVSKLASWTLGRAPRWNVENDTSAAVLGKWWAAHHAEILRGWRGALTQADAAVVVNSDLSVTLLPPDTVDPIVADDDYGNVIGWRVTQVLVHPETTARMTMVDEYYADRRVHRVEVNGVTREETVFPNLIGRIPLVWIANSPDVGQVFGHAEAEPLLGLLHKYGEVFEAAIEGNVLQGRPTPVLTFETVQDMAQFDAENATTENQQLPDGSTRPVKIYEVDLSQLLVASGANFEYKAPGSFTGDTAQLLEIMFYLMLQHAEIPEFMFGNAISSSKASAESQLAPFVEFIKARRSAMADWLTEIATVALAYLAIIEPGVSAGEPTLQWEALDQDNGTLTLETIKWAYMEGLIDRLTALKLMPVEVDDPESVLEKADEERAAREEEQRDADEQAVSVVDSVLARVRANGGGGGASVVPAPASVLGNGSQSNGNGNREGVTA